MPKNVQTTIHMYSFHMLVKLCSKSFKLGFSSMWTENFQIYKLGLEKIEELEIKLPTFVGLWRKQGASRKNICFINYTKACDLVDYNKLWTFLKEMWLPDHLICLLRNLYAVEEATVRPRHGKINIQKTKVMASGPITSWQMEGDKVEAGTDSILRGSKITMIVTAAMKLKDTCFLEGKLDSMVKSRDITTPTKVHIVKAMIFLIVIYRCESWTIK